MRPNAQGQGQNFGLEAVTSLPLVVLITVFQVYMG